MDTNVIPGHHISDWKPEKDPVLLKHVGKLNEETSELIDAWYNYIFSRGDMYGVEELKVQLENEIADVLALIKETSEYLNFEPMPLLMDVSQKPYVIHRLTQMQICISRIVIAGKDAKLPDPSDGENKELTITNEGWLYATFCEILTLTGWVTSNYNLDANHIAERVKRKRELKHDWLRSIGT